MMDENGAINMRIPVEFLDKIHNLLDTKEYEEFVNSFDLPRYYGLRVNTLKISVEEFLKITPFVLEPVPWTKDGFYYREGENPGKHPYYYAGLYYIQEPSAMLPGAVIAAKPGENILDLCAAPGGKTVQIAAGMKGKGLLVANDINSDRVKALVKNIELCGVTNAVVTNDTPKNLSGKFMNFFDKILVDAPCSGEGMFRKDEDAAKSWGKYKCDLCSGMQRDILSYVDKMLKPGGYLVYSTCTFSPEENEQRMVEFIENHPDYELCEVPKTDGIADGRPEWANNDTELKKTARLWPHKVKGEGHFVALLHKKEADFKSFQSFDKTMVSGNSEVLDSYRNFEKANLNLILEDTFIVKGNNLYSLPVKLPDLSGIKVAKFGRYIGEALKGRFEPSHSFVLSLGKNDLKNVLNFDANSVEVIKYLKGETLMREGEKALVGILVDGFTLGWSKQTGDMLKNLYPKGWRKMS
jgi:NOL1/NOP2/sun family putative RNA methylase